MRLLEAVWCSSMGPTWTLELREVDGDTGIEEATDSISSGVPILQPEPTALAHKLLAARGLWLLCESTGPGTRGRRWLGYVCASTELVTPARPLGLMLHHPIARVCVIAVNAELDMLTAPLLGTCVRHLLVTTPAHLILDLQSLRFLGVSGLTHLLYVQELAQQTSGFRLHLTGLVNRAVARPLEVTGLRKIFDTYPTLADALAALTNGARPHTHHRLVRQPGDCAAR